MSEEMRTIRMVPSIVTATTTKVVGALLTLGLICNPFISDIFPMPGEFFDQINIEQFDQEAFERTVNDIHTNIGDYYEEPHKETDLMGNYTIEGGWYGIESTFNNNVEQMVEEKIEKDYGDTVVWKFIRQETYNEALDKFISKLSFDGTEVIDAIKDLIR